MTTATPANPPPKNKPMPPPTPNGGPRVETPKRQRRTIEPRQSQQLAPRIILQAVEGWGKTTIGAYTPSPIVLMAPGETGYDTLLQSSLVPSVPAYELESWADLLGWLDQLAENRQGCDTLVGDALGGFERLCHEMVCDREFKGDWGEKGFEGYKRGYEVAIAEWLGMLSRLDKLHKQGMMILLLGHSKVKTFKNPLGPDYDRWVCDVHDKTWSVTHKWADAAMFGNYLTVIQDEKKAERQGKGKAIGGTDRVLYTERRDAFDAKNRYGMPPEIWLPTADQGGAAAAWPTIWQYIQKEC